MILACLKWGNALTHNSFQEVHQDQDPDPEDQVLDEEFEEVAEEMEESDSVGLLDC